MMSIFGSRGCGAKKMNDLSRFTERPHSPFYQCWRKEMIWSISCCTFCLLLHGSLSESSTANDGAKSRHAVDPCIKHGILAQSWRNVNNARDVDKRGNTHCDKGNDFPGWYRFRAGAGNKMLDKCPTSRKRCGTHAPMWLTESHPTVQAGVTSIKACAYWISNCTWSDTVKVKLCPAGFYVYYLPKVPECSLAYCGESHDLCLDNNGGCERKCSMVNDTAVCSCPKDFRLASNKKTCEHDSGHGRPCRDGFLLGSDKRTCVKNRCKTNNGGCSHICVHKKYNDRHHCQCPLGSLLLEQDGKTCQSKPVTVACTNEHMQIDILRPTFHGLIPRQLQLADPSCQATGNSTFITFKSRLTGCGAKVKFGNSSIRYSNVVKTRPNYLSLMKGVVTWASTVEIHVVCKYVKHRWVGHSFTPVVDKIRFREERLGNFSFKMQQFKTENFVNPYSEKDFPVAVKVRDKMYFLLSVDSKDEDVKLFAKTCKATTTPSPKDPIQFLFISNGCPVSHSVKFLPCQNPKEIRLSLKAFQFLKILPQIYLHCKLTACHSQDTTSRCTNGCLRSDERRKKREEADDSYQVTAGPFQYVLH